MSATGCKNRSIILFGSAAGRDLSRIRSVWTLGMAWAPYAISPNEGRVDKGGGGQKLWPGNFFGDRK